MIDLARALRAEFKTIDSIADAMLVIAEGTEDQVASGALFVLAGTLGRSVDAAEEKLAAIAKRP